jgi:hypothetical protein
MPARAFAENPVWRFGDTFFAQAFAALFAKSNGRRFVMVKAVHEPSPCVALPVDRLELLR